MSIRKFADLERKLRIFAWGAGFDSGDPAPDPDDDGGDSKLLSPLNERNLNFLSRAKRKDLYVFLKSLIDNEKDAVLLITDKIDDVNKEITKIKNDYVESVKFRNESKSGILKFINRQSGDAAYKEAIDIMKKTPEYKDLIIYEKILNNLYSTVVNRLNRGLTPITKKCLKLLYL